MKYSLLLLLQKFRKITSALVLVGFFTTMIIPWHNVWAVTGTFSAVQTVANVSPVSEIKATRTLSVDAVPADTETIIIGTCTVTFSAIAGATTDESACDDDSASIDLDTGGGDTPRTAEEIGDALRAITNLTDTGHGALTISGSTIEVILTTSGTETSATAITFTDGTSEDIASTNSTSGVVPVSAVAQVVTFTPSAPTAGETFRANINGTNYDYTVVGTKTVAQVVTAMTTLMDAHANAVCTDDTTHVTCTATPAGTAFTSYSASVVDITAPTTQDTSFATSVDKQGGATVTIVSGGETGGATWFAPNGTSSFSAGATMTTASGTATSILAPATAGAYRLYVIDAAGNLSSASTAILTVDNSGPVISAISSSILFPPGTTILWTTSEGGSTRVEYGLTDAYGSLTTLDDSLTTAHSVTISGLSQVTTYHYRVISVDAAGNSTTSGDNTFTTSGVGGGGGGGGGYIYTTSASFSPAIITTVTPTNIQVPKAKTNTNSAPEEITPVSFKNIQKHINNSEVPVLRSADESEFATREQTVTLAVTIRGVELAEYYACETRHTDTQGDNISDSTCQIAERAQDAGIISRSKTTFRPLDSVTRVEAYSMLMKSACITIDKNSADWRVNVIEKAVELGFTKRTFETFSPDRSILISEIIAIGKRLESWKEQNGSCAE